MISQWKQELIKGSSSIFEQGKKKNLEGDHEKEIAELHQKIGQLTIEVDWFKKKLPR